MNGEDSYLTISKSIVSDQWNTIDTNNSLIARLPKHSNTNRGYSKFNLSQSNNEINEESSEEFVEYEENEQYFNKDVGYLLNLICCLPPIGD